MKLIFWGSALAVLKVSHSTEFQYTLLRTVCCQKERGTRFPSLPKTSNVVEQLATAIEAVKVNADCRSRIQLSETALHGGGNAFARRRRIFLNDNASGKPIPPLAFCIDVQLEVELPHALSRKPNLDHLMPSDFETFSEVDELRDLSLDMYAMYFGRDFEEPEPLNYGGDFSREDAESLSDDLLLSHSSVDHHGGRQAEEKPDKLRRAMQYMFVTGWPDAPNSRMMANAHHQVEVAHSIRSSKSLSSRSRSGSR